ncbi:MAG: enolase C-terminal domain-like protein, partial [Chloroflexota bacterium]
LNAWRAATILTSAGIGVAFGVYYDVLAAAATHLAAAIPGRVWPAPMTALDGSILQSPLQPIGLTLPAPSNPGLGVAIDRNQVERFKTSR